MKIDLFSKRMFIIQKSAIGIRYVNWGTNGMPVVLMNEQDEWT